MGRLKDDMIPMITEEEIHGLIATLAKEIEIDYTGKGELLVICPLKGSVIFCADLIRQINLPMTIDFVHLTSPKGGSVKIIKDITTDIADKHVLIVEEIIDAGRTLNFLKNRLLASNPASVRVCAMLDKPARRELPIKIDYIGQTIDDRFVIGYGMDSEEKGRNYRDIFYFTQ